MSEGNHIEIERKYLIRRPDAAALRRLQGCEVWEIEQTYLWDGEGGQTRRVRKVVCDGETRYYRTFKRRVSDMSSAEDEAEIDFDAYAELLNDRDAKRRPVEKTRYRFPHGGYTVEIDVYPFWDDRAIMEIELDREDADPDIPGFIAVVRDVTGEKAYKNRQLAKRVPFEEI